MEVAVMYRWGTPLPGKIEQAVAFFAEVSTYLEEVKERGEILAYEPFLFNDGDLERETGFILVTGQESEIGRFMSAERTQAFNVRATQLVHHYEISYLTSGVDVPTGLQQPLAGGKVLQPA